MRKKYNLILKDKGNIVYAETSYNVHEEVNPNWRSFFTMDKDKLFEKKNMCKNK